jgi:hypothetical protein
MRTVHQGDGIGWIKANPLAPDAAIITSLPDSSEIPSLGFDGWKRWFIDTSALLCSSVAPDSAALFFQTDVKRDGAWVDKAYLVQRGAEQAGLTQVFHKIVCRAPAGTATFGRPAYAHLLGFSKAVRPDPGKSTADVIPRLGAMTWSRAMGTEACVAACKWLLTHTQARTVVDPFCGLGTILSVAEQLGLNAIGVELSPKRAGRAQSLTVRLDH